MNYIISAKALEAVGRDRSTTAKVVLALATRFGMVTVETPRNWINKKHIILTTPDAVEVISECTGLLSHEIIERRPVEQHA